MKVYCPPVTLDPALLPSKSFEQVQAGLSGVAKEHSQRQHSALGNVVCFVLVLHVVSKRLNRAAQQQADSDPCDSEVVTTCWLLPD